MKNARKPARRKFDLQFFEVAAGVGGAGVWPTAINQMEVPGRRDAWSVGFFCIHLVLRSGLRFRSHGSPDAVLDAGDVFLIQPQVPFSYFENDDGLMNLYAVRLAGPLVQDFVAALGFSASRLHFAAVDPSGVRRVFRELQGIAKQPSTFSGHQAVAALHRLPALFGGGWTESAQDDDLPARVLQYLERHLERGENVEQLAARFGVSRYTFFLRFRERFSASPAQVLIQTRIARAKALLETTGSAVNEIARLCGYRHVEHFHRQFRSQTGMTAGEWRTASQVKRGGVVFSVTEGGESSH